MHVRTCQNWQLRTWPFALIRLSCNLLDQSVHNSNSHHSSIINIKKKMDSDSWFLIIWHWIIESLSHMRMRMRMRMWKIDRESRSKKTNSWVQWVLSLESGSSPVLRFEPAFFPRFPLFFPLAFHDFVGWLCQTRERCFQATRGLSLWIWESEKEKE